MLVTFRIVDTQTRLHTKPAIITARQLAKLMATLRDNWMIVDADEGEVELLPINFEFNANSLALAKLAALFDWHDDIIAIVEEAQFFGRSLRVERVHNGTDIQLCVSEHIALARDLSFRAETATKLFSAIGINTVMRTSISIERLRDLMQQPSTTKAFNDLEITTVRRSLDLMLSTDCGEQMPRVEWALDPA